MPLHTESHTQSTELHIEQKHMVKTTSLVQSGSYTTSRKHLTRSYNLTATYNRIHSGCHQAQGTRQRAVGGAHTYTHRHTRRMTGAHVRNTYHSRHPPSLVSHPPTPAASTHLPTYLHYQPLSTKCAFCYFLDRGSNVIKAKIKISSLPELHMCNET